MKIMKSMKYSTVQTSNFVALAPVVVIVLSQFKIIATEDQVVTIIASLVALVGVLSSIWRRYQQGGVTLTGKRLPEGEIGA